MCTVSFIPGKDRVYLTSNRDEKSRRMPALPPEVYAHEEHEMLYPRDGDAGGSWITLCANGNAGVLLNGAFETHRRCERYRKSRGLVFLDLMQDKRPLHRFLKTNLAGIEPFTLVLWQENNLYECRLDEKGRRFCFALKNYRPYIWSSATLYSEAVRKKREQWFLQWLNRKPLPGRKDILHFHRFAGEGNAEDDLFMNRNGQVATVSITSVEIGRAKASMHYTDVCANETTHRHFHFLENLMLV